MVLVGAGLLWVLAGRATGDRQLRWLIVTAYGARILLSLVLFAASLWAWPILRSLQLGRGFWMFAVDSQVYQHFGAIMAKAWARGIEFPDPELGVEYFAVVATVYRLLGPQPLYAIVVNCWLAAISGLFAYLIGRRLGDRRTALIGAGLVSFWPSSFLWSSQLLKDGLSWWLLFATLWLILNAIPGGTRSSRRGIIRPIVLYLVLGGVVILLTRVRFYLGSNISLACLAAFLPAGGYALLRKEIRKGLGYVGIVLIVVVSTLFARTLDVFALLSPTYPEIGHFRLALQHRERGEIDRSEDEFHRAMTLNGRYREAYLGLAGLLAQERRFEEALEVYRTYLEREDPEKRLLVKQLIAKIYLERGNEEFTGGRLADAVSSYERALPFDPSSAPLYTNLGAALAYQQKFEMALEMLDKALAVAATQDERDKIALERERVTAEVRLRIEQERLQAAQARLQAESAQLQAAQARLEAESAQLQAEPVQALATQARSSSEVMPTVNAPPATPAGPPSAPQLPFLQEQDAKVVTMALALFPQAHEGTPANHPEQADAKLKRLRRSVSEIDEQVLATVQETTAESLGGRREGFVRSGGYSLMDAWARISTPQKLIAYLPRALTIGLLAPFPWQWFDTKGSTGLMRTFAGAEMVLFYLLIPWLLAGTWKLVKRRRADGYFLLAFIVGLMVPVSLVVANLGTLFRLRLLFLLPLLVVAAQADPVAFYRRVCRRVIGTARGPGHTTGEPSGTAKIDAAQGPPPSEPLDVAAGRQGAP